MARLGADCGQRVLERRLEGWVKLRHEGREFTAVDHQRAHIPSARRRLHEWIYAPVLTREKGPE